jgi:hypothetical protein
MDEDPYAALAISLMENGTDISGLYLDPIGSVQTLGCPATRGTRANNNMDSYSTYYNVQYGTRENSTLVQNIRNLMRLSNNAPVGGESYLCNSPGSSPEMKALEEEFMAQEQSGGKPSAELIAKAEKISEKQTKKYTDAGCRIASSSMSCPRPASNLCCVRIPFGVESSEHADKALTYSSLNRYLSSPLEPNLRGNNSIDLPARRLQRFNGYSDAMGGAEPVSAWRSGVNYYQTPAYGYQAMDFILNTLWNNPFVKSAVEEAEKKLEKKSKSVLCQDRDPGVYTIEHDHYFLKHANAPRMTAIISRWNQNPNWTSLSGRFQNVLKGEFAAICKHRTTAPNLCNQVDRKNLQAAATEYFRNTYRTRRTVAQANRQDQGFTWTNMSPEQFTGFIDRYRSVLDGTRPMKEDPYEDESPESKEN